MQPYFTQPLLRRSFKQENYNIISFYTFSKNDFAHEEI